ncbi:hypothetical protein ACP179_18970 [Xenorhabdus stockiae]|uniref:hypothetical protein n=1 Tax=Xenorhabdus stockiae TaxID=351614 RepID=UPI003CE68B62
MTKHIVSETGERLKLLVDGSSGVPLFYPNLYSTSQIRGAAKSIATIQSYITSMKVLYSWAAEYSVDIEDRWKRAEWLKVWEIDSLRDYCSLPLRSPSEQNEKIVNIKQSRLRVKSLLETLTRLCIPTCLLVGLGRIKNVA